MSFFMVEFTRMISRQEIKELDVSHNCDLRGDRS